MNNKKLPPKAPRKYTTTHIINEETNIVHDCTIVASRVGGQSLCYPSNRESVIACRPRGQQLCYQRKSRRIRAQKT